MKRLILSFLLCIAWTSPLLARTPYAGAISIPGKLEVENYDNGGQGITWYDTTPGNAFGFYRFDDVDVGPISSTERHIGGIEANEWVEYTVNVATAGTYTVRIRYASAYSGSTTFRLRQDGVDVGGGLQSVTSTGSWSTFTDTKTITANLSIGTHILRLEFVSGHWNPDWLQFTLNSCTAPSVSTLPANRNADPSSGVTFNVTASGTAPLTYQWLKDGAAITNNSSAQTASLRLTNVEQWRDAASYSVRVTNGCNQSVTSSAVRLRVWCGAGTGKPGWVQENIARALLPRDEYLCDWAAFVEPSMPNSFTFQGSFNIPVLAAAVAFIDRPVTSTWNMDVWWKAYLRGELGDRGSEWYYGGKELGSYVYQAYNETAVMAVHYHAQVTNQTEIALLAKRWLRATFALHALAAMPKPPLTLHAKGQMDTPTAPYDGPYTAFAGDRSSWGFWVDPDRNILLARALGLTYTAPGGESSAQKNVRQILEGAWKDSLQFPLVYGLDADQRGKLIEAINFGKLPPNLKTDYLGRGLRTYSRYDIVAWPRVKATVMWQNHNTYTAPTFGVAYFLDPKLLTSGNGREAHFLYPWQGLWDGGVSGLDRNGICHGTASIDVPGGVMSATHPDCEINGVIKHRAETVSINGLPTATPSYRVILQPTAEPSCTPACP